MAELVTAAVVLARLAVPLAILRYPLPGVLAALVLDGGDQTIFQATIGGELAGYQSYDKALDIYYLTVAYTATVANWRGVAFEVGRFLWYYRLVGVVAFELSGARELLLIFPNTFEYYFIAIEAAKVAWDPFRLAPRRLVALAAFIWIFVKLPQEWWIHVAQLDVTDAIKEVLFGVPSSAEWTDAIANRPLVLVGVVGLVAVVVAIAWSARHRLPPRDWPPTLSASQQARELGWAEAPRRARPFAFFDRSFVEKVALVTLVGVVFARILPGATGNVVQVAVGATTIIALTTLLSQTLARRGVTWRSAAVQFVAISAANIAIVVGLGLLLPFEGGETPAIVALFLVELLTLIVVLYDRARDIRQVRGLDEAISYEPGRPRGSRMIRRRAR